MNFLTIIWQQLVVVIAGIKELKRLILEALDKLDQIIDLLTTGKAVKLVFITNLEGVIRIGENKMDMTDSQQVAVSIQPVDKKGNPALLDGVPVWASSDETVVTVVADDTGLSATVFGVTIGTANVVVTGDADLGSGVTPITGTLEFNITAGQAVSITITAGTPTEQ